MKHLLACALALMTGACQQKKLPILGEPDIVVEMVDGKKTEVTEYHTIRLLSWENMLMTWA